MRMARIHGPVLAWRKARLAPGSAGHFHAGLARAWIGPEMPHYFPVSMSILIESLRPRLLNLQDTTDTLISRRSFRTYLNRQISAVLVHVGPLFAVQIYDTA